MAGRPCGAPPPGSSSSGSSGSGLPGVLARVLAWVLAWVLGWASRQTGLPLVFISRASRRRKCHISCALTPEEPLMTSTALARPGAVASPKVPSGCDGSRPGGLDVTGTFPRARSMHARRCCAPMRARSMPCVLRPACMVMRVRAVVLERSVVRQVRKRSWLFRASRLIWCTIDPQINRVARIHHVKLPYCRTHELVAGDDARETHEVRVHGAKAPGRSRSAVSGAGQ